MTEQKKGGLGKVLGIGCLTIVVILVIGGIVVVKNISKIGRTMGAKAMESVAAQMISETGLSSEEQAEIMKPVRQLAKEIKAGDVSMEQMGAIMEELSAGALPGMIMAKTIEIKYVAPSGLTAEEKTEAKRTLSRYSQASAKGVAAGDPETDALHKLIMVETTDSVGDQTTRMKAKLSDTEVRQALALMKSSADRAKIANKTFEVDIGKALSDAIQRAKAKSGK